MMEALRAVNSEPIPGYRLLEPLGSGGFGEVWKCEAPGGLLKAIKIVRGADGLDDESCAEQELRALRHIRTIRHIYLLSIERVEVVDGDLIIVMELADQSLHDVLQQYREAGQAGLPRGEALGYLHEAAEVLDMMNQKHGLQHLDIKPRNLFVTGRHVQVADFGLVASLTELYGEKRGDLLRAITPLYAAPEVFEGQPSLFSDQYSLAITYHELLTGICPYRAKTIQQMMLLMAMTEPDLSALPEADRPIVLRAMRRQPRERYPSCTAFIEALEAASMPAARGMRLRPTSSEFVLGELQVTQRVDGSDTTAGNESGEHGGLRREHRVVTTARPAAAVPVDVLLPGYRLHECLQRGPTGEQWQATGPGGQPCLVRFLTLSEPGSQGPSEEGLRRLLALRHPALPPVDRVEMGPGRVALISQSGETNLLARYRECHTAGQQGLRRQELLNYLACAAEALDELYHTHQLQHLLLAPRLLAATSGDIQLLDFALAELLWLPAGLPLAALNSRYAALEMFDGLISDSCDQYSLALMYQELLVGVHPFRNLNARQMANPKLRGQPDVALLPGPDRPIVLQALSAEPERRFRSCSEFILALEGVTRQAEHGTVIVPVSARPTVPVAATPVQPPTTAPTPLGTAAVPAWRPAVEELASTAGRGHEVRRTGSLFYRLQPGVEVEHRCWARLAPGMAGVKLAGFREQLEGNMVSRSDHRFVIELPTSSTFLDRCLGRTPGLTVEVCVGSTRESSSSMVPIRVRIAPSPVTRSRGEILLANLAPNLLFCLQTYLQSQCERADQERYPHRQPVQVQIGNARRVDAEMRDIGRRGMGLLCPIPLHNGPVQLSFCRLSSTVLVQVQAWVRDCFPVENGNHEIEISFES